MNSPSFADLIPTAIVVMFVDLLESTSIARWGAGRPSASVCFVLRVQTQCAGAQRPCRPALSNPCPRRALARKNGYELIYNREIVGLGLANFAGAMSNCYTTTGSFSRSAVNNNSGEPRCPPLPGSRDSGCPSLIATCPGHGNAAAHSC